MGKFEVYIPMDRRLALARGESLSDRAVGAALFADISGFTPLTEALAQELGPQRGAEELTRQLNRIYEPLIDRVHQHGGSVISFSGDAVTCWFNEKAEDETLGLAISVHHSVLRALACAQEMQAIMNAAEQLRTPSGLTIRLGIKVAVTAGLTRRFLVGEPRIQAIDILAGSIMDRLAAIEHQANQGEVVVEEKALEQLTDQVEVREWRDDPLAGRVAVLSGIQASSTVSTWTSQATIEDAVARDWVLRPVYERLSSGQGQFLAELRPAVALFISFSGIDYDGDDAAGEKLNAYIRWVQGVVAHYDGALLDLTMGDKGSHLYVVFGAPIAHEDDATRALRAALELRTPPANLGFIQNMRMGLGRGQVRTGEYGGIGRRTYGAIGNAVNVAARLMTYAKPGQILATARVTKIAGPKFEYTALEPIHVKGVTGPLEIFEINARQSVALPVRQHANIVGRVAESSALYERLNALIEGHGSVAVIEGDAGIGKSRLIEELVAQARIKGVTCLVGTGNAVEQSTLYHAWRPVFSQAMGLDDQPEDLAIRQKHVLAYLEGDQSESEVARLAPLLSAVLPLDLPDNEATAALTGQVRAEATRDLLIAILGRASQSAPLLVVIEDAHWLDSASWALLPRVVERSDSLLFVLATRPLGEAAPPEFQGLVAAPEMLRLSLGALGTEDVLALIKQRLGAHSLPDPVSALIVERAEGNPFFSEELAYALRDSSLIQVVDGECRISPNAPDLRTLNFPDTVQGVITSRIDRLAPPQQLTIKVASVIGRIFALNALREIHPVPEDLPRLADDLAVLSRLDLTPLESSEPELAYIFKHVITQEVAYSLMLYAQRQQLHRAVAEWYERRYANDLAPYYAVLAYHWTKAVEVAPIAQDAVEKAITYSQKAGEQALGNNAHVEATQHFRRVLEILNTQPSTPGRDQQELTTQTLLGYSLMNQRGYGDPEVEHAYRRAQELSQSVGIVQSAQLGPILYGLLSYYSSRGEYDSGDEVAMQILHLGESLNDPQVLLIGHNSIGLTAILRGNLATGFEHTKCSYELADIHQDAQLALLYGGDFRGYPRIWHSTAQTLLGFPEQGKATFEETLQITRDHPYTFGFMLTFGIAPLLRRDVNETLSRAQELGDVASKYGFFLLTLVANIHKGWGMARQGSPSEGLQLISGSLPIIRAVKLDSFLPMYLALYAEAQAASGQIDEAQASIEEALLFAERSRGNFYEAELYRLAGELRLAQGAEDEEVEQHFHQAIEVARRQGAKWWELRAANSLAEVMLKQGKEKQAHDLLKPIYSSFSEGFDTVDLTQARELLNQISC